MTPIHFLLKIFGSLLICSPLVYGDKQKGHWGAWGAAGPCSVTCGSGIREIRREWIPAPGEIVEGGKFTSTKSFYCLNKEKMQCPKDGAWSGWMAWTECTKVCDGGTRSRKRECVGAMYGGQKCPGKPNENEKCNREPCPVLPRNFDMTQCSKQANYTCASKKMCIPRQGRCDGNVQCHDGSDEIDCPRVILPGIGSVRYDLGNAAVAVLFSLDSMLLLFFCSAISLYMTDVMKKSLA